MRQSDIITFLDQPQAYGLPENETIGRFDTHISIVFLAGPYAYKLKRAIALPFVDFSRLEDRHHFCEKEMEANHIASANLYIGVVPVRRHNDQLVLDGTEGEVVEWLVKMHRFDQRDLYDHLSNIGHLGKDEINELCDQVCTFYQNTPVQTEGYGGSGGMVRAFEGHYKALANCPDHLFEPNKIDQLKQRITQEITTYTPLMDERAAQGYVRHCHGDLHLRNICRFQGQSLLFDAIEFEPDFAVIDIFYDFAFLLMDLCHRGEFTLANSALNRYLGRTGDIAALHLLGLYMASRSLIRTHVNGVASQNQKTDQDRIKWENDARTYLEETIDILAPRPTALIAIGGFSGSGKSSLAQRLAPTLGRKPGAFIARTDMIRKRLMGVSPNERLPQNAYTPETSQQTYSTLFVELMFALHSGQCAIADGVFAKPEERAMLQEIATSQNVPFIGIWLDAPADTLKDRVSNRQNDPSDATPEVVDLQQSFDIGGLDWHRIDATQDVDFIHKKATSFVKNAVDFPL
jgi:aminoglycoside phosphotransferase family enzyme/predicted kinase